MGYQKPRVKICCISNIEEAKTAIYFGASAIGLVSEMPSGPGVISEDMIAEIARRVPAGIDTFLLTSKQNPEAVIAQQQKTHVNTIQLVDAFPFSGYAILRQALRCRSSMSLEIHRYKKRLQLPLLSMQFF